MKKFKGRVPNRHTRFEGYKIAEIKKWIRSIRPKIKELADPRGERNRWYPLDYIVELYLVSCLAGHFDCKNAEKFLKGQADVIAEFIPKAHRLGIPSHDCFCDILSNLEQEEARKLLLEFNRLCLKREPAGGRTVRAKKITWREAENSPHRGPRPRSYEAEALEVEFYRHICMDGKSSRAAADKKNGGNTPYTGSYYDAGRSVFLDLVDIPNGKEAGEATRMRSHLKNVELEGSLVSADALHTSRETMAELDRLGALFLLRVKEGSHENQFKAIKREVEASEKEAEAGKRRKEAAEKYGGESFTPELGRFQKGTFKESDKNRTTKTTLKAVVDDNNVCTEYCPLVSQLVWLKEETSEYGLDANGDVTVRETSSYECCFFLNCVLPIEEIYRLAREHWGIESAHWILDNVLGEDRSTGRTGNQVYNRALFRRLALNMLAMIGRLLPDLKKETTAGKMGFLHDNLYCAVMLVDGYRKDYCLKMADVFEKRKNACLLTHLETGSCNVTFEKM